MGPTARGPSGCRAGPVMVTIPRSESRKAGSRPPKQEAWGGGRKAGGAEGNTRPWPARTAQDVVREEGSSSAGGRGEGGEKVAQSSLDPDTSPSTLSAPALEGLTCFVPALPQPAGSGIGGHSQPPLMSSLNNSCLHLVPSKHPEKSQPCHWSPEAPLADTLAPPLSCPLVTLYS